MDLSYESIMDYYRCPLLYHFKHNLEIKRKESPNIVYKSVLLKVIMYFYYSLLNNRTPTLEDMQNRWQTIWNKDQKTIEDILFKENTNTRRNRNIIALKTIQKFYESEIRKKFVPIVVNSDVRVQVGDYYLTGTLELVREVKEKRKSYIEITGFTNSIYNPSDFLINHDFKLTFQSYAFRKLFELKEDVLNLRNIKRSSEIKTSRNADEFKRFETIVNNIGYNVDRKKFHPIVTHQCRSCPYMDICDKYKF